MAPTAPATSSSREPRANSLALIAQNDVIVTNNLTAADTTNQTLELIADNEFLDPPPGEMRRHNRERHCHDLSRLLSERHHRAVQ